MTTFEQLDLSPEILKVLQEMGFESPTEIQEKSIPLLTAGDTDCIGIAQTGTGKTAAFGLPLLENVNTELRFTQALVLAPTRELGQQIADQLHKFSKYLPKLNVLAVYGGASIVHQMKELKKPQHIIIATPGRLRDLIKRKAVNLSQLSYLVLDEADEMLNMGFKEELDEILEYVPDDKNTWLFSATMAREIKRIVNSYMTDPVEIKIDAKFRVNPNIEHQYAIMKGRDKTEALKRFLDMDQSMRGVVFCRTKRDTQELAEDLLKLNYKADCLHGDMSQHLRTRVMGRFKNFELQVLIATDVAARGIDVNDLTHVFHYALPDDNAYYTHRSGRTARAGKKGISLCFISGKETHKIRRLEKELGIEFTKVFIPKNDAILEQRIENWCEGVVNESLPKNPNLDLLNKVNLLLDDLSKEELIAKFLHLEIEKLNLVGSHDLNQDEQSSYGGGGGGRNRSGRNRGGRNRGSSGGRDRNRSSRGGGSSYGSKRPSNFKSRRKRKGDGEGRGDNSNRDGGYSTDFNRSNSRFDSRGGSDGRNRDGSSEGGSSYGRKKKRRKKD